MKKSAQKTVILAVSIVFIVVIASCEEQQSLPSTKRSRLIAVENMELKKQLQQRDKQIQRQKELLTKCRQEKEVLEKRSRQDIEELMGHLLLGIAEESQNLRQENESLKAEVEKLKKGLEEPTKAARP